MNCKHVRMTVMMFVGVMGGTADSIFAQTPLGTEFTYQGRLRFQGKALDGAADFIFTLFDADVDGNAVGADAFVDGAEVRGGLFTVPVDFGAGAFNGQGRWIEIGVRTPAWDGQGEEPDYTFLSPRQAVTATPYAIYSAQTRGIVVDDEGRVGIGTFLPGGSLEVAGGMRARGGAPGAFGNNDNGYAFSGQGGDNDSGMFSAADGLLQFYTNNIERLRINESGNVGVGTADPQDRLHVNGTARVGAVRFPDGTVQTSAAYRPITANVSLGTFDVPDNGQNTVTFGMNGIRPGMSVIITPPYSLWNFHALAYARVVADNRVEFRIISNGGGDRTYGAGTWRVTVFP